MKYYVDLHIHSALSPCADDDMTPCNIVNMAFIKGLDFIAVTDHNSAENCKAVMEYGSRRDIVVIPGIEAETREEVHVLCLFPDLEKALEMQRLIYASLPDIKNREDVFGRQLKMDSNDNITGEEDILLLNACGLSFEDVFIITADLGGVAIPAHVDRDSYSVLSNLGFIPPNLDVSCIEISSPDSVGRLETYGLNMSDYTIVRSSDAHHLGNILEREVGMELEEKSIECLLKVLRSKN